MSDAEGVTSPRPSAEDVIASNHEAEASQPQRHPSDDVTTGTAPPDAAGVTNPMEVMEPPEASGTIPKEVVESSIADALTPRQSPQGSELCSF